MNFKTLTTAPLAALLLFGGQVQAKQAEVTPATIGQGACEVAKTRIPMGRAMEIALKANTFTSGSLLAAASHKEVQTMTWHAAKQACPERFEKGVKKSPTAVQMEQVAACSKAVSNAPRAERLKVMMSAC